MKKFTSAEIRSKMNEFSETSRKYYGSYSYATGYYESMFAYLLQDLSAERQATIMRNLTERIESFNKETA